MAGPSPAMTAASARRDGMTIERALIPAAATLLCALSILATAAQAADLDLTLTLEPESGRASVVAIIHAPADRFSLARDLGARDIAIDGQPVLPQGDGRYALPK